MQKTATLLILLALVLGAAPASASTPLPVTIDSEMDIPSGTGTFIAYGPAVDAGLFCPSGTVYDHGLVAMGYQSNIRVNLRLMKQLVCDDGSGEIYLMLNVRIVYSSDETLSNWVLSEGLGAYTGLRGQGKIVATGEGNFVDDHYTGLLHND